MLLSMSIPLRLDMKKMSASMATTAIQEIMHAVLRWILSVTCGFLGVEALFARDLGSVFVSHNASQSSKNVPARRGRAGTFTKGAGAKAPLSQVSLDSRFVSTVQTQSKLCSHTKETMDMQRTPGKSGGGALAPGAPMPPGS